VRLILDGTVVRVRLDRKAVIRPAILTPRIASSEDVTFT